MLWAYQLTQQAHLQGVCVLELVNGDKGKAAVPFVMHIRVTAQQTLRQNEQVIKVYGVLGLQFTLVSTGNGRNEGVFNSLVVKTLVAHARIFCNDLRRFQFFTAGAELHNQALEQAALVTAGIDREVFFITESADVLTQNAYAKGMEGANRHFAGGLAVYQAGHAVSHLVSSFVGERKSQNTGGIHALLNHVGNAAGNGTRFTCTGSGQNKHRTVKRLNGLLLCSV